MESKVDCSNAIGVTDNRDKGYFPDEDERTRLVDFVRRVAEFSGVKLLAYSARRVKPYDIPYGALVPKKVDGLLFCGRCISASHEALASCRVMGPAMPLRRA